jgi:hypothetical protein
MACAIETPRDEDGYREFVSFYDRVYQDRPVRWAADESLWLPVLLGESAFVKDRDLRPFVAREGGEVVARVLAVADSRYMRFWNERLGHLIWFEAMPDRARAVRELMDAACAWLAERDLVAARAGSLIGMFDMPFAIDTYGALPPHMLRQNPAYYHALIKQAGFETEQGYVDYQLDVTESLQERWRGSVEVARAAGYQILPVSEVPRERRARDFTATLNDTFKTHWGWTPFSEEEFGGILDDLDEAGSLETSILAYEGDEPIGVFFGPPDDTSHARLAPGRELEPHERLNAVGIGVRERARGRGINFALGGLSFLTLARRGHTRIAYTLVLDDNWASRRTGEGLGCTLCGNYVTPRCLT